MEQNPKMQNGSEDFKKRVFTIEEVAKYLKVPVSTVYQLAQQGKIFGVKVGRRWRFLEKDILDYFERRSQPQRSRKGSLEKREHARINTEIPARLKSLLPRAENREESGMIQNLSESGLYVEANSGLEVGDQIVIVFILPEPRSSQMELKGRVVRLASDGVGIAIKFRNLSEEAQETLRTYVG